MCGRCLGRTAPSPGIYPQKMGGPPPPPPFSDGKALGTRLYGGRESCEYKGTPENKKGIPFFLPHTLRAAIAFSRTSVIFFFPSIPPSPNRLCPNQVKIRSHNRGRRLQVQGGSRVHAVPSKKPNELFLEQGADYYQDKLRHPRRHKLTRELASLRAFRVEFQEIAIVLRFYLISL